MQSNSEKIDIREMVERLRRSLATPTPGQEQNLAEDLATYSQLCKDANQRLRDCLQLIKRGQYSNAMSLASQEPSLLDLCSELEIPERELLPAVATTLQVPVPEAINPSLVEALQEAHIKGSTADTNRRLLHKLTLARAPLPARLAVMRRLLVQDTSHPYWEADIRTFEVAWFKQAVEYCRPYAKNGDAAMIELVLDDLRNSGYVETPPPNLFTAIEAQLLKAHQQTLPTLAERIKEAYDGPRALPVLKTLLSQWFTLAEQARIAPDDSKFGLAEILRWFRKAIDDENKHREEDQAKSQLAKKIQQRDIPRIDLERAYSVATAHGVVDPMLESQYRSKLAEMTRRRTTFLIATIAGSVALVGTIAVGSFWIAQARQLSLAVTGLLNELQPLTTAENFDEVIRRVEAAPKEVASNPDIVSLGRSARDAKLRLESLTKAVQEIVDCPSDQDVEILVKKADDLAVKDAEKKRVSDAHTAWKTRKTELMNTRRQEYDQKVALLLQTMSTISQKSIWNTTGLTQDLPSFSDQIQTLHEFARTHGLGDGKLPEAEKQLAKLQSSAAVSKLMAEHVKQFQTAKLTAPPLQEISNSLSGKLADASPDAALTQRLKAAKTDLLVWQNLALLQRQMASNPSGVAVTKTWDQTPLALVVNVGVREAKMRDSRSFATSGSPAETESQKLMERLTAADMRDVTCVKRQSDTLPFYTRSPVLADDKVKVLTILDSRGSPLGQAIRGPREVYPAPQSVLVNQILPELTKASTEQWHSTVVAAYQLLLKHNDTEPLKNLDPLLKLELIDRFLNVMTSSSSSLRAVLEQQPSFKTVHNSSRQVTGDWYQPIKEEELESKREAAAKLCQSAPKLSIQDAEQAARKDAELLATCQSAVDIVGLLSYSTGEPAVALFLGAQLNRNGRLFIVSENKWVEIGQVTGQAVKLNPEVDQYIGWPVIYLRSF